MPGTRRRQRCQKCKQVTTQEKRKGEWHCLCCESAKFRDAEESKRIEEREKSRPAFNKMF